MAGHMKRSEGLQCFTALHQFHHGASHIGQVRPLMPGSIPLSLETWLTMHEDLRNNPRCKVTFGALSRGLQDYIVP